jgi:phenylacetate-CoA ligase
MKPGVSSSISNIRKDLPLTLRVGYGWVKRKFWPNPIWGSEDFDRTLTWLQKTEWWSKDQLEEMQLKELQDLVKHAYEYVPYYRRIFDERRLKPDDIVKLDDLQKLPTITREDVRDNLDDLIMRNIDRSRLIRTITNGTTGKPLTLYGDKYTIIARDFAFMMRQWYWAGYKCADRLVTLRGNIICQNITKLDRKGLRRCWDYNTNSNELVLS